MPFAASSMMVLIVTASITILIIVMFVAEAGVYARGNGRVPVLYYVRAYARIYRVIAYLS